MNSDGCAVTRIEMLETVAVPSRFGQIGTSGAKARLARSSACPVRRTGELDFRRPNCKASPPVVASTMFERFAPVMTFWMTGRVFQGMRNEQYG